MYVLSQLLVEEHRVVICVQPSQHDHAEQRPDSYDRVVVVLTDDMVTEPSDGFFAAFIQFKL